MFVFARPISYLFVQDPNAVVGTVVFVRVGVISLIMLGTDGTSTGTLRAIGDTRWPMYGKIGGLWLVMLPVAFVGTITSVGIFAIYLAYVLETTIPAIVSTYRLKSGIWKGDRANLVKYG